jgi:hypothetical protein
MSDAACSTPRSTEGNVDYFVVHPVPGHGEPIDYVPYKGDDLFVGEPLPSALVQNFMDEGAAV